MVNSGISPLDSTSNVGMVRLVIGDDTATGTTAGEGSYSYFSDDAITVALSLAGNGVTRAVAILVKQLALSLTIAGQSIAADDFKINTLGKGKDLMQVANGYDLQADAEDARAAREGDGAYAVVGLHLNTRNIFNEDSSTTEYDDEDNSLQPDPENPGYLIP